MKIRTCFVSNSSSSSFIVAKSYITKKQQDGIRDWYKEKVFQASQPDSTVYFGENGSNWEEDENYIIAEVHGLEGFGDLLKKLKVDETKLHYTYG